MQRVAYRRVSTNSQSLERQLPNESFDKEFHDYLSAKAPHRSGLQSAIEYLRPGDQLIVHSIDRLARSLSDLERLVKLFTDTGVTVEFRVEKLVLKPDSKADPVSKMMLQVIGSIAEFERSMIKERQREGIAAAIAAGKQFGRPRSLTDTQLRSLRAKRGAGKSIRELQDEFNLSKSTVYRLTSKSPNKNCEGMAVCKSKSGAGSPELSKEKEKCYL